MKKNIKKIIIAIVTILVVLILSWIAMICYDYNMCFNSEKKEPKFAKLENDSDGIYEYDGLGYNVKIRKITLEDGNKYPEKIDMYLFGTHLNGAVLCYNSPEIQTNGRVSIENLPKDYSLDDAINDNCIVSTNDNKYYNTDEMDLFLSNLGTNIPCSIRVVYFTIEGDMIIEDINFVGNSTFKVTHDSTRDKFSNEKDRIITYEEFDNFNIENGKDRTAYFVSSDTVKHHIISISKNAEIINN